MPVKSGPDSVAREPAFFVRGGGVRSHASQFGGDLAAAAESGVERQSSPLVSATTDRDAAWAARMAVPGYVRIDPPRADDGFVMLVQPPPQYAGQVGAQVKISSVSDQHVCVIFESGIRESFPVRLFSEYFKATSPARVASRNGD